MSLRVNQNNAINTNMNIGGISQAHKTSSNDPVPVGQGGNSSADSQPKPTVDELKNDIARLKEDVILYSADVIRLRRELESHPEPQRPEPQGFISAEVPNGGTVSHLAEQYHVTLEQIKKANPGVNLDRVRAGQSIKIPHISEERWNQYQIEKNKHNEISTNFYTAESKVRNAEAQIKIKQKTIESINFIEQNKNKSAFAKKYNMSVDYNTGNIIITTQKSVGLYQIKDDFHLADGALLKANGEDKISSLDRPFFSSNYDSYKAPEGTVLIIPR